jgi:hypothetical protein
LFKKNYINNLLKQFLIFLAKGLVQLPKPIKTMRKIKR